MAEIRLLCLCLQLTKSIIEMSSPAMQMLTTCLAMFGVYGPVGPVWCGHGEFMASNSSGTVKGLSPPSLRAEIL